MHLLGHIDTICELLFSPLHILSRAYFHGGPGLHNFSGYIVFLAELGPVRCPKSSWYLLDDCFQLQEKAFQS